MACCGVTGAILGFSLSACRVIPRTGSGCVAHNHIVSLRLLLRVLRARVAELADAPHSKCGIERCVGSSPTSGTVFSLFRGFLASECAQSVHLWAPSGAFFIAGRWCGRRPPCLVGSTVCRSIPVHGRSWLGQHDLAKIWCELLYRIAGCSPGSSLAAVAGCSSSTWCVRGRAT